jgi:hypothetical protein
MRKHKSVISILLAVMMIFTFMPAMAFAAPITTGGVTRSYTDVKWSEDFHTATVSVKEVDETGSDAVTTTKTIGFDFYDEVNGVEATKKDVTKGTIGFFVARDDDDWYSWETGTTTYYLYAVPAVAKADAQYVYEGDYDYVWDLAQGQRLTSRRTGNNVLSLPDTDTWADAVFYDYGSEKEALEGQLTKTVYDATYGRAVLTYNSWDEPQLSVKVDAGDYSAWYKSNGVYNPNPAEINMFNGFVNDDDYTYFTVTYPEYNAYAVDGKDNQVKDITVSMNAADITKRFGAVNVSTATRTIKLEANVNNNANGYFAEWYLEGDETENEYNVTNQAALVNVFFNGRVVEPVYGLNDDEIIYDGKTHNIVFTHPVENTTIKYFVTTDLTKTAAQIKDADWADTFPGIKDAGTYNVFVKFFTTKGNTVYEHVFGPRAVTVAPFMVPLTFTQDNLTVEYGKYTLAELEEVVAKMVTVGTTPDSADLVASAFNKYKLFKGLFEEAGSSTVGVTVDRAKLAADTAYATVNNNYVFVGDTLNMTVEKVANDVQINAPSTKTYKASKKTKKLAKNKSFTISATARMGNPTFSKVSGNDKIKVSKAGKITVKKGLKKGKTYKVKVKALVQGTANYKQASATKTIKIKIK